MPKATAEARQQNAHERALATVARLPEGIQRPNGASGDDDSVPEHSERESGNSNAEIPASLPLIVKPKEDSPLPETAVIEALPETKPEPRLAPPPKQRKPVPTEEAEVPLKREPGEDLIEYINRLPMEVFTAPQAGIFIYKQSQTGNVQLDKIFRPITFDELKNIYAGRSGAGNYYLQFNTRDKRLNAGGQRFTFDGSTLQTLGEGSGSSLGGQALTGAQATSEAIRMVAEASREANKANIELITDITKNSIRPEKGIDVAALITGIATLMPKQDNTMVQFMIAEANRRADAAEKEADRRETRAKEEAERREREADRRATEAKAEADRQRERDKEFFGILLKQSESKADSLNQMTGLLTSFMKVKETIDDTMSPGPKGPWDLIGNVADGLMQHGPAIMASFKGATPQQVQQIQQQQNPEAAQPQPSTPQMQFRELVQRIGLYCQRDSEKWNVDYIGEMIQEEYGGLAVELFENTAAEKIVEFIKSTPPGDIVLAHPDGPTFIGKLIEYFKTEEPPDEAEPEIIMVDPKGVSVNPRQRKINGKVKAERAG